jgi:predicted nucleic acid-binding protein
MILVDTSVLIDFLRGNENAATQKFDRVLTNGLAYGISELIYMEVLQGAASPKDFERLKTYLDSQRFYSLTQKRESFSQAARLYMDCRAKGITVRRTIDCLVAQTAVENRLLLLHNDNDYTRIARVLTHLEFF